MDKTSRIAIIGKSLVGRAVASAVRSTSAYRLTALVGARETAYPKLEVDQLFIACRDDKIEEVAKKALAYCAEPPRLIAHFAGSLESTVLPSGPARLTLHPIQTFAKPSPSLLKGIWWMASSEDIIATRWAATFVKRLGAAGTIELPGAQLSLYHTLGVFASNFVVLLGGAMEEIAAGLGKDPVTIKKAFAPLMQRAVENVLKHPSKEVLTGPIARKDFATLVRHDKALSDLEPELRKLYDAFLEYAFSHGY